MNDAIEILEQICADVNSAAESKDMDLFWLRMQANCHDAEMLIATYRKFTKEC